MLCHRRLRRVTKIAVDADGALLSLRGTWLIAYGTDCLSSDGLQACPYRLQVADATTGTGAIPRGPCADGLCGVVESVAAGRAGRAAWCARSADGQRRIVGRPPTGGSRVITTSSRIRPNSLRTSRDGRKVLWRTSVAGPIDQLHFNPGEALLLLGAEAAARAQHDVTAAFGPKGAARGLSRRGSAGDGTATSAGLTPVSARLSIDPRLCGACSVFWKSWPPLTIGTSGTWWPRASSSGSKLIHRERSRPAGESEVAATLHLLPYAGLMTPDTTRLFLTPDPLMSRKVSLTGSRPCRRTSLRP